ncbi:vacuolar protein sorting-associated protein 1 [Linnemannia gamsii]|uniref:Vacuolar protein sorting-associated protein 1 n=1 Tax=Linnemannia gamsii TaxID=64522 RepID=A0A9P6UFX6_9FUNG|nr:vacuolar protein sorting-associated protein 1 [Linnemannia gamsii]
MPVRYQPKDIEQRLRNMILEYITKPNVIILAVTPANTTIPSSDGLMLAKLADPEGARTIGVLTKIDLMDAATDVVDILSGRVIPLRLGYIPVINLSQRDIERGKSISLSLHAELSFFENHDAYKAMAQYCGIPYLSRKLVIHLIRSALPKIETKIQDVLTQCQNELADPDDMLREGTADPASLGLVIITKFCNEFRTKFKKFPQLGGPFYQAIIDFLRRQLDTTKKVVTDLT